MVHLQPLPGSPRARLGIDAIISAAVSDARILMDAGFHGVIVENMHDAPYIHGGHGPETVAAMTLAVAAVRQTIGARAPLGVQVLSGGNREALAIALASEANFIRCENFVFAHVADEGLLTRAEAGPLLRFRRSISAEHIAIYCDIKKKHASHALTADISLADAAHGAEFFGADGLIVTGTATGRPTSLADLAEVRDASRLPLLVGSGVTPDSVRDLLHTADALIVGSYIKKDGLWSQPIDRARCREIVRAADSSAPA